MISPDYVQATGIPTFKLESPVRLQLACVGSKSTISYGARSSIVFGNKHVEDSVAAAKASSRLVALV